MKHIVILLLTILLGSSCVAPHVVREPTGIPYSSSPGFFFHMKQASLESGYDVTETEESIKVHVSRLSYLLYGPGQRDPAGIDVTFYVQGKSNETDQQKRERSAKLQAVHDGLLEKARTKAEGNSAWR